MVTEERPEKLGVLLSGFLFSGTFPLMWETNYAFYARKGLRGFVLPGNE